LKQFYKSLWKRIPTSRVVTSNVPNLFLTLRAVVASTCRVLRSCIALHSGQKLCSSCCI